MKNRIGFISSVIVAVGVILIGAFFITRSPADIIYTNDGREIKGIVVEEYKDRLVLSTADGEITVFKSDIRELSFDSEEENLIRLGDQAMDRRDYARALSYYERALKINPESKAAKNGMAYLQSYILRQQEMKKEEDIRKQADLERYGSAISKAKGSEDQQAILEKTTGMTIAVTDNFPQVTSVKIGSPAYDAGVRKGDFIVAIWGRLTGYMSLNEILDALLKKSALEIRCTIERTIDVPLNTGRLIGGGTEAAIGASLTMELDGLTVGSVREPAKGLEEGDLITAIGGEQTRYMPLKKAVELISNSKFGSIKLTLRRSVIIWRLSEI
ncbi:MAG: PDZ domain-containing protein [Candidatus Omnitrophica bacterium]|nr:PDZ domain-containing protein [Candidatus Omnitrophota bacterium]MCM8790384.1 PDZ domain-containing protein [Candidatus Omnitrophota bacterium]